MAVLPKLSIVATLYRSERYVDEFCQRAAAAARQLVGEDFEIVLVNDGSPDRSLDIAVGLARQSSHIKVVDLSRNFGHHKAMMTGLSHASGDAVFLIDSDLEEEPEWLLPFTAQMDEQGGDVVYGVQANRKGGLFERWTGHGFYTIFNALSGLDLPRNVVVARLMTRRYVDALLRHTEREVFMAGLWQITGFEQRPHTVVKHSTSETTYSVARRVSMLVNSITSFSNRPLHAIFYVGALISVVDVIYIAVVLYNWAFHAQQVEGWSSLIASVWLLGGLIISFIGIIGIYLAKMFSEIKARPYTIVRAIHGPTRAPMAIPSANQPDQQES